MMETFFTQTGALMELEGNRPLQVTGSDSVFLIKSGKVDIFSLPKADGEVVGPRRHFLSIDAGGILVGIRPPEDGMRLIAVGAPDTTVLGVKRKHWMEVARNREFVEQTAGMLDQWIRGLSAAVRTELIPRNAKEVVTGKEIQVSAEEELFAGKQVLWVMNHHGLMRFMGREDLPVPAGESLVPLSNESWLTVVDAGEIHCTGTRQWLLENEYWNDLDAFHNLILGCLELNLQQADSEEHRRLQLKSLYDRQSMESALTKLASILETEKETIVTEPGADPLLATCRLIGRETGIKFKEPPNTGGDGREPDRLADIARASGVRLRKVMLRDEWWKKESGPLLAFKEDDNSPVALIRHNRSRNYEINDAIDKTRHVVTVSVANTLKPEAVMFYRPFPDHRLSAWDFFTFGLKNCSRDLVMIFLIGLFGALLGLAVPVMTGILFNSVIPSAEQGQLVQIVFILIICAVATTMFEITKGIALLRVESRMDNSLQAAVWDRLISLPPPFFRNYSAGDLTNRSMGVNAIRQILSSVTVTALLSGLFSSLNFILLFYYEWTLALVASAIVLLGIICTGSASFLMVRYQRKVNEAQGKITGTVLQFITGIAKIRASGTENRAFSVWGSQFKTQKDLAYKVGNINNFLSAFNSAFPMLASMAIFAWVTFRTHGTLPTGDFMAFNSAYINFQGALMQMTVALAASLNVVPLYERLVPIIDTLPEADVTKDSPGRLAGEIEVNRVAFRYTPDGPLILQDVSLTARPGEFIALVGGSGSGKSTIMRLLLGFEKPESGTIYYDGQDLASVDVQEIRRQIGVVLQNGRLMAGDLRKNIIGATNLSTEDAWEAARLSGLEEDIKHMPMGMNTVIGAGGGTLSGGQRQRLLIARAIVRKPRIIFFDEATSALDNQTQAIVSRSLESLQATRVVIAHRLSTIINADRIYVLDAGKIVQSGTYKELMEQKGLFLELATRQLG